LVAGRAAARQCGVVVAAAGGRAFDARINIVIEEETQARHQPDPGEPPPRPRGQLKAAMGDRAGGTGWLRSGRLDCRLWCPCSLSGGRWRADYAGRWPIETAFGNGKQHTGAGQAHNRLQAAVERTTAFALLVQSLIIIWYALHGNPNAEIQLARADAAA
jgi:hypothetical protein